jgi:hypothetical protein
MSDALSGLPPGLKTHLTNLRTLSPYGVLALEYSEGKPLYIWWGDRSQALASLARLTFGIHTEEDEGTEELEDEEDDDAQFELFGPIQPDENVGQYL